MGWIWHYKANWENQLIDELVRVEPNLIVALDSVDEGFIGYNLSLSIQEGLETIFHCLKVLLADLRWEHIKTEIEIYYWISLHVTSN